MKNRPSRTPAQRWMLIVILLIAAVPFLAAWYYARHPGLIARHSNYGTLITPAQPLSYDTLLKPLTANPASDLQQAKGRWIMLHLTPTGACARACQTSLQASRQIRLLLNKDISRVRRILLFGEPPGAETAEATADGDLLQGSAQPDLVATLIRVVGRPIEDGTLILIDPFANAMMWYPPAFDPYGVLRDLKHLLRASQIG